MTDLSSTLSSHLSPTMTVGDIVARDLRSAAVFTRYGIDFCCGGRQSLGDACRANGVDPVALVRELAGISRETTAGDEASEWPLERVVDRILNHHHAYIRRQIPIILTYTHTLAAKKGPTHPELVGLAEAFEQLAEELMHHLAKEENILFPFIDAMLTAQRQSLPAPRTPFGTIQNPVRVMEAEHQHAGDDMRHIRTLTGNYQPPPEACTTWRACYAALEEFERDLHVHVHLENNILFPAAARLEEELS